MPCMMCSCCRSNFKPPRMRVAENLIQALDQVAPFKGVDHFASSWDAARARGAVGSRLARAQKSHRQVNLLACRTCKPPKDNQDMSEDGVAWPSSTGQRRQSQRSRMHDPHHHHVPQWKQMPLRFSRSAHFDFPTSITRSLYMAPSLPHSRHCGRSTSCTPACDNITTMRREQQHVHNWHNL